LRFLKFRVGLYALIVLDRRGTTLVLTFDSCKFPSALSKTLEYLAPEIVNGESQTSALDWWTFGIFIYEMVCGHTPFRADTQEQIIANIKENKLQWPSDVPVSSECKRVVRKLLRTDASKRLGAVDGAHAIKASKWFSGINFVCLRGPLLIPGLLFVTCSVT
jgi:protein-serine/threonine kinase